MGNSVYQRSIQERTVAAAVARAAHVVSVAALLSPAAGEAAGRGVLRTLAVCSHRALFITAAWIPLRKERERQIRFGSSPSNPVFNTTHNLVRTIPVHHSEPLYKLQKNLDTN